MRLGARRSARRHLGLAISVFSKRLLEYSLKVGAKFNEDEKKSVLDVWRYTGYVMGIPESILYTDGAAAESIYKIGYMCEPPPDPDSVAVANMLIQAIPSVADVTDSGGTTRFGQFGLSPFAGAHREKTR